MPGDTQKVFFYGLFMDVALLARQGIEVFKAEPGYVDGFRIAIGERATLLPSAGGRSYGLLMEVPREALAELYAEASVSDYIAEEVAVVSSSGVRATALCYNLPKEAQLPGTNPAYAASLLALAEELALPTTYLEEIRRFLDKD